MQKDEDDGDKEDFHGDPDKFDSTYDIWQGFHKKDAVGVVVFIKMPLECEDAFAGIVNVTHGNL